jgi:hypothetical protein
VTHYTSCGVGPGLVSAFLMVGRAVGPWVFSEHTNEFVSCVLRFVIRPGYLVVNMIRSSWTFWMFGGILILFLSFAALFVTLSTENLRWLGEKGRAQDSHGSLMRRFALFLRDCFFLVIHAARVFLRGQNGENKSPSVKREWRTAVDCFALPLITGIYCYLALTVLQDDKSQFNARVLSFGTLILSLIVISNLLIILAMRRDLTVTLKLKQKRTPEHSSVLYRSDAWFVRVLMVATLYIVSVLGFAYRIYPFVPTQKAGGDYSTADAMTVHLTPSSECSSSVVDKELPASKPFIVLSEDANWIYLAPLSRSGSGGGPACWRWGPFCDSPSNKSIRTTADRSRPTVYTVNRHCIASIVSVNPAQLSNSNTN